MLMVPRVNRNLMASHILSLKGLWKPVSARTHNEERRIDVNIAEVVEQL